MLTAEAGIHSLLFCLLIQCLHRKTTLPPSPIEPCRRFQSVFKIIQTSLEQLHATGLEAK